MYRFYSLFIFCSFILSCSYSFRGQTAGNIKSIAIPTFQNESSEFGLAETITETLVRAFQKDGILKITGEDQADAVLMGKLLQVQDQPYTARSNTEVEEYRFSMSCEISLIDIKTQEPIWTQVYPSWAIYPYTGSLENRSQAIEESVQKLQQDLLNKIAGNW